MSSDKDTLLAAIRANPEEDTPRLMYADWLDEQGGQANTTHAEYIRLEIENARNFPEQLGSSEAKAEAQKRTYDLYRHHRRDWFPEVFGLESLCRTCPPSMARGFPYCLNAPAERVLKVGEWLMELAPITEVGFGDIFDGITDSEMQQFVKSPWVSRLRVIRLCGNDSPDWATLGEGTHFTELRNLFITAGWLDRAGAERIAAANRFPKLEHFFFGANSSDDAPAALFSGKAFTKLRSLELFGGGAEFQDRPMPGLKTICQSSALRSLKSFKMESRPTPRLSAMLAGSTFWRGLEELDLQNNNLRDPDIAAMLKVPSKLRKLKLDFNKITAKGAELLAEHPAFAKITELDLTNNPIGDKGVVALVTSPHARNLQKLELSSCKFGLAGITAIAESRHLANLRELSMLDNKLDLKGAHALAASPHLANLKLLYIGDEGVTAPAKKTLKKRFGDRVICE